MDINNNSAPETKQENSGFINKIFEHYSHEMTNAEYAKTFRDHISTIGTLEKGDRAELMKIKPLQNAVAYFDLMQAEIKKDPHANLTISSFMIANNIRDQLLEKGPESFGKINKDSEQSKSVELELIRH